MPVHIAYPLMYTYMPPIAGPSMTTLSGEFNVAPSASGSQTQSVPLNHSMYMSKSLVGYLLQSLVHHNSSVALSVPVGGAMANATHSSWSTVPAYVSSGVVGAAVTVILKLHDTGPELV